MDRKLKFELVPDGCWYSNLRTMLSKKEWDMIKKDAKERSGGKCSICGRKTQYLDAHERWSYDEENKVQKLEDVVCVCKTCHSVIHIGRTSLMGNIEKAEDHYMKVNGVSYAQMKADLRLATEEHQRRNRIEEWALDLTWLKRFL